MGEEEVLPLLPTTDKSPLNSGKSLIVKLWGGGRYIRHCFLWPECSEVFSLNSHIMFCKHLGSTFWLHSAYITKNIPNFGGGQPEGFPSHAFWRPQRGGPGALVAPPLPGHPTGPLHSQWAAHQLWALPSSPITLPALRAPPPGRAVTDAAPYRLPPQALGPAGLRPTDCGFWTCPAPAHPTVAPLSQGRGPGGGNGGTSGLSAGRGVVLDEHADALAAGEGVQGPRLPGQRPAAEPTAAACSGHATGGAQRQGARRAAAAAGGPGDLRARGGYRRAEREPLGGAGRAVPRLGSADADDRAELGGQQEKERPGAGSGNRGHRGVGGGQVLLAAGCAVVQVSTRRAVDARWAQRVPFEGLGAGSPEPRG